MPKVRSSILYRAKTRLKIIWLLFQRKILRRRRLPQLGQKVIVVGAMPFIPATDLPEEMEVKKPAYKDLHRERPRRHGFFSRSRPHGPNMAKRQPCPKCHGQRPRVEKVDHDGLVGAYYYCSKDKLRFFVYA